LCISYYEGDTQFGLTGTVKINENAIDATLREIHEETTNFLSLDKKCIRDYGIIDVKLEFNELDSIIDSNNRSISRFTYNITEDSHIECIDIPSNINDDDITQKICVYLYGNKDVIQQKFSHFNSFDLNKEPGVKTIVLIAIKDLEHML
jgi:hypothetical protein